MFRTSINESSHLERMEQSCGHLPTWYVHDTVQRRAVSLLDGFSSPIDPNCSNIKFYAAHDDFGFLSNFFEQPFTFDGNIWPTSEHFYQAHKFLHDSRRFHQIRKASTPDEAARLGNERGEVPYIDNWKGLKRGIMLRAVYEKFSQNPVILRLLHNTGDTLLLSNEVDTYWGTGNYGDGCNWLGKISMTVRTLTKE